MGYKMEQQRRLGVGFTALLRTKPVWAICVAQYTGSWGFYGEWARAPISWKAGALLSCGRQRAGGARTIHRWTCG